MHFNQREPIKLIAQIFQKIIHGRILIAKNVELINRLGAIRILQFLIKIERNPPKPGVEITLWC